MTREAAGNMGFQFHQRIPRHRPVRGGSHADGMLECQIPRHQLQDFIVSTVTIHDEDLAVAAGDQRFAQFVGHAVVGFGTERHGAAEGEMMLRGTERQGGRHHHRDAVRSLLGRTPTECFDRQVIRPDRQVRPVLFQRTNRPDDQSFRRNLTGLGTGEFLQ